jgi:hypothetical protein
MKTFSSILEALKCNSLNWEDEATRTEFKEIHDALETQINELKRILDEDKIIKEST